MLKVIHGLFSAWAIGSRMEQSGHRGNNRMEMRNMNTCKRKKNMNIRIEALWTISQFSSMLKGIRRARTYSLED